MCRHLAYVGPPVPVAEPVTRGASSLRVQSWAPRDMRGGGTINADGFGVAWWAPDSRVHRYRNPMPIWSDPAVDDVLTQISSTSVLAAVRSATPGMPVERTACAPFADGSWAFSHNGVVPDWRSLEWAVDLTGLDAATDSAALWLLMRAQLATVPPADALAAVCDTAGVPGARLNLLLGDGVAIWATTYYHSLSVLVSDAAVVVASEPYDDDPNWQQIPDRKLVTARPGSVTLDSL